MTCAIGIDPGTVSIDVCAIRDGALVLDRSIPTATALAEPEALVALLRLDPPADCIAGPSGYGLPLMRVAAASEEELALAYLAPRGASGGIGGLRALGRALARSALPVVFTPGVVHLASVPAHRKVNRVDMGTADKVCAAALGVAEQAARRGGAPSDTSFVLLELGGAFTAALAVDRGRIVDGAGGSSGAIGFRAAGALDGEVAFLAGTVEKETLFGGGAASVWGDAQLAPERFAAPETSSQRVAFEAYVEGAAKAVAQMRVAVRTPHEILLSGRLAGIAAVRDALAALLPGDVPVRALDGFARVAKHAAQGAALIADGLAGGRQRALVETLGLREASGTVLDHLYVVTPEQARRRLGVA